MTGIFFWRDKNGDFYEAPALQGQQGIQGPPGTPGSMIYNGTALIGDSTVPTTYPNSGVAAANVNDYYLNTMNCNLYLCVTGGNPDRAKWKYLCSLRGDYINDAEVTKDSGDLILQSNQGVRLLAGNVVGPAGAAGADGAVGPAGPQGPPGNDYVLTEEDKAEIADVAADLVVKVTTAAEVSIADAKGEFAAQNVEDALSELKGETKYATEQADKLRLALFNSEDFNMSEDVSKISLKKADVVERDDDRVVTSAAVYTKVETEIGNINALLATI